MNDHRPQDGVPLSDAAYAEINNMRRFCQQRRINLAEGVHRGSAFVLSVWASALAGANSTAVLDPKFRPILHWTHLVLPFFGILLCAVYGVVSRAVHVREKAYVSEGCSYEARIGGRGANHMRAEEIAKGGRWGLWQANEITCAAWLLLWVTLLLVGLLTSRPLS